MPTVCQRGRSGGRRAAGGAVSVWQATSRPSPAPRRLPAPAALGLEESWHFISSLQTLPIGDHRAFSALAPKPLGSWPATPPSACHHKSGDTLVCSVSSPNRWCAPSRLRSPGSCRARAAINCGPPSGGRHHRRSQGTFEAHLVLAAGGPGRPTRNGLRLSRLRARARRRTAPAPAQARPSNRGFAPPAHAAAATPPAGPPQHPW